MTRIVQRVQRDLNEIAAQAPISSAARHTIQARLDQPTERPKEEAVMLTRNEYRTPRLPWGIAIACSAVIALIIAGIVVIGGDDDAEQIATDPSRAVTSDDDTGPADQDIAPNDDAADEPATATGEPATDEPATAIDQPAIDEPADETTTDEPAIDEPATLSFEQLAALPWANLDDPHDTPALAVAAFVEFLAAEYGTLPEEDVDGRPLEAFEAVTVGDFAATGDHTGTVTITQDDWSLGDDGHVYPVTTVDLAQAGPDDSWWVAGASSDTMRVDQPAVGSALATTFTIAGTNPNISGAVRLHVFIPGRDEPVLEAFLTGGGVFAWGDFIEEIDLQTPPATPGTLVVLTESQVTTVPVVFTGEAPAGVAPGRPWHPAGSAHADPLAAVDEFLAFAGFGADVALRDFGTTNGHATFYADGDPHPQPDFSPTYDPDDPASHRDTTSIDVLLDPNGHWVVTGATSIMNLDVDLHGASVSSPMTLDVADTVAGWGVTAELWPDGATAPISEVVVTEGADPLAATTFSTTMTWDADVRGPATLIVTSHDQDCDEQRCDDPSDAIAVTTVRVRIDS